MQKFESVLDQVESARLSQLEAAEILGMSERIFRRWRDCYTAEGPDGRAARARPGGRRCRADRRRQRTAARAPARHARIQALAAEVRFAGWE